jgi:hypothetical protein
MADTGKMGMGADARFERGAAADEAPKTKVEKAEEHRATALEEADARVREAQKALDEAQRNLEIARAEYREVVAKEDVRLAKAQK